MSAAVETHELTRRFGEVLAVDHLDLEVSGGELFGLLGPNGAGKTTTIKMLITLLPPTSGTARVAGLDVIRDSREVRRSIGYVPQLLSADGAMSGYENLLMSARLYHLPKDERDERIAATDLPPMNAHAISRVEPYIGRAHSRLLIPKPVRIL